MFIYLAIFNVPKDANRYVGIGPRLVVSEAGPNTGPFCMQHIVITDTTIKLFRGLIGNVCEINYFSIN